MPIDLIGPSGHVGPPYPANQRPFASKGGREWIERFASPWAVTWLGMESGGRGVGGLAERGNAPRYVETRATSSIEVTPERTLRRPSSRRVCMPCSRATAAISASEATLTVRSLIASLISITENSPMRPR
jgi:hypothetical protein